MEIIKGKISHHTINNIFNADRKSTVSLYDRNFTRFAEWFNEKDLGQSDFNFDTIIEYLSHLFKEGKQFSTINNYRYAIHPVLFLATGESLIEGYAIKRIMNGFRKHRPKRSVSAPKWDLDLVLQFLKSSKFEPLEDKSLMIVFEKLCFLLIFASGRRPSDMAGLGYSDNLVVWNCDKEQVTLYPHPMFIAKNRSMSFNPEPITIPTLGPQLRQGDDNSLNCPVRSLKIFLHKTQNKRDSGISYLLCKPPSCKEGVTPGYVSKTIKHTICRAYAATNSRSLPITSPMAKDTRKMANSLIIQRGASLEEVMRAAGWKSSATFMAHYLIKKPLTNRLPVVASGRVILPSVAGTSSSSILARKTYGVNSE